MIIGQRINELFSKYLSGNCTPAEWEELLVLVSGIEENDATTLEGPLLGLWESARDKTLPSTAHLVDREKMYAAITRPEAIIHSEKLTPEADIQEADTPEADTPEADIPEADIPDNSLHPETTLPVRHLITRRFAAAAAIIAVLITGWIYWAHYKKEDPTALNKTPDTNQIRPGIDKAVLTLASGKQIILDSAGNGAISQQGNTTIINYKGRLSYEPAKEDPPSPAEISYNTVTTARANQYQLVLPDGSKVWLNAVSSIRFPTAFAGRERTIEMTGEAYFEIAQNASKPFYVKVNGIQVEVLGTHFNINAYTDEAELKTSLLEGSVRIVTPGTSGASGILKPGEEASFAANTPLKITTGNVDLAVAWKNGYFQFDKAPLPVIMRQIGRWYDLDIHYEGTVPDRVFKGKLQRALPLSGILHLLQKGGVHFRLESKALTVTQ